MAKLERSMFREYDLRGRVNDEELNEYTVGIIAKAYGTMLRHQWNIDTAVVGHDYRQSSEWITEAVIQGLVSTGVSVINLGMVLTPMMYSAQYHHQAQGGVMVTASHNPSGWSGFKLALDYSKTFGRKEMDELYKLAISEQFATGSGTVRFESFLVDYTADLLKRIKITRRKPPLRVVVNAGNGTPGAIVPRILRAAGYEVVELYCNLDWNFPYYFPNPASVDMMNDTGEKVRRSGADIGFAIDGDGDRLGVTDEKGEVVWPDRYLILLARQVLDERSDSDPDRAKIIFDVKCSQALREDIRDHGGTPIMEKTGHSYIKQRLGDEKAPLGGEMSGHIFFGEPVYHGFDDAVFAALKLAEYVSRRKEPLSAIIAQTPYYVSTPTLQVKCPVDRWFHRFVATVLGILGRDASKWVYEEDVKYEVVNKLTKEFQEEGSLFKTTLDWQGSLDRGDLPEDFRREFEDRGVSLSAAVTVTTEEADKRWRVEDADRTHIVAKVGDALYVYREGYDVIDISGARVSYGDGWGLVRASSNLPVLTTRFEARTEERVKELMAIFREKLAKHPEVGSEWESG